MGHPVAPTRTEARLALWREVAGDVKDQLRDPGGINVYRRSSLIGVEPNSDHRASVTGN